MLLHMKLLTIILTVFLFVLSLSKSVTAAEDRSPLEELDLRISDLESALYRDEIERYRKKHDLEYSDGAASNLRIQTKMQEKELLELRQSYNDRLKVISVDVRTKEKEVGQLFDQIAELGPMASAIQREIALAESPANSHLVTEDVSKLKTQLAQTQKQLADLHSRSIIAASEFELLKESIAEQDDEARDLRERMVEAEKRFRQNHELLHETLNKDSEVNDLDRNRQELGAELQRMRVERERLLEGISVTGESGETSHE